MTHSERLAQMATDIEQEAWFQDLTLGMRHLIREQANRHNRAQHLLAAVDEAERRLRAGAAALRQQWEEYDQKEKMDTMVSVVSTPANPSGAVPPSDRGAVVASVSESIAHPSPQQGEDGTTEQPGMIDRGGVMIEIEQSKTADTRSCDFTNVTKETLLASSRQHIGDVSKALSFFQDELYKAEVRHDYDKISDIDGFHADFVTGFKQTGWWDRHRQLNRHHLLQPDGVRDDVNLIDVLDLIADCVMAGMARTGEVYPLDIDPDVLMHAFQNTVALLKAQVVVKEPA